MDGHEGKRDGGDEATWIFGYGSLIWRPGFPYRRARVAGIDHRRRRFWQGSTDHRGVPGAPGRVVTLVEAPGHRCWGRAFELDPTHRQAVLARLDHREKGGYQRLSLSLQLASGERVRGLTWIATADNANYLGPADDEAIARQVAASSGPSGPNSEYVLRLDEALRADGHEDSHVARIAALVRRLARESGGAPPAR